MEARRDTRHSSLETLLEICRAKLWRGALAIVAVAILIEASSPADAYTVVGTVWRPAAGGGYARALWNPVLSPGGMLGGNAPGVTFDVGAFPAPPLQAAADAAVGNALLTWLAAGVGADIAYVPVAPGAAADLDFVWGPLPGSPGATLSALGDGTVIVFNAANTVRLDGESIDLPTPPGEPPILAPFQNLIEINSVFTTAVHEVGHDLGLDHTLNMPTVMTPQNTARNAGFWVPIVAPPGGALPAGSLEYLNPRAFLAADDILGLRTLYSVPTVAIGSNAPVLNAATGIWTYSYSLTNASLPGSDYTGQAFTVDVPLGPENMTAPPGWTATYAGGKVTFSATPGAELLPGALIDGFSFQTVLPPARMRAGNPQVVLPNLQPGGPGTGPRGDLEGGSEGEDLIGRIDLAFDPMNIMLGGEIVYAPIPEPSTWLLVCIALLTMCCGAPFATCRAT